MRPLLAIVVGALSLGAGPVFAQAPLPSTPTQPTIPPTTSGSSVSPPSGSNEGVTPAPLIPPTGASPTPVTGGAASAAGSSFGTTNESATTVEPSVPSNVPQSATGPVTPQPQLPPVPLPSGQLQNVPSGTSPSTTSPSETMSAEPSTIGGVTLPNVGRPPTVGGLPTTTPTPTTNPSQPY